MGLVCAGGASAQKLPEASRTVYKCMINGKVVYTDAPCAGATKVDVEPPRGFNKSTGRELVGADVRRERQNEAMAEALKPVFGEDAKQRETRHRRFKLSPKARAECESLDRTLPVREADQQKATGQERGKVQDDLLQLRKRFHELRC